MERLKSFLNEINVLSKEEWETSIPFFELKHFKKGAFMLSQGEISEEIGFIKSGLIRLFFKEGEEEKNTFFVTENCLVCNFYSYLSGTPSKQYIQALEDSSILCISKQNLENLATQYHNWEKICRRLTEFAYTKNILHARRLQIDDYETRYLTLLNEKPLLIKRLPLYMIASYLDMTPETLSRIRKRIQKREKVVLPSFRAPQEYNPLNRNFSIEKTFIEKS